MTTVAARATLRRDAWCAGAVAPGALVLLLGSVTVVALHRANEGGPGTVGVTDWWLLLLTAGAAFGGIGAWLVHARPRLVIGWLMLGIGVAGVLADAALEYGVRGLSVAVPMGVAALWVGNWLWVTVPLLIGALLPQFLPDGRLGSPRWRPALAVGVAATVGQVLTMMLLPYESWSPALAAAGATNPVGTKVVLAPSVFVPLLVLTVVGVLVAVGSVAVRWHSAVQESRQQLKWILLGTLATLVLFAAGFAGGPLVTAASMLPLPAAILVAVLRHGLWNVDLLLGRALVYGALTAAVVGVYVACVGLLGGVLGAGTGAPLLATAVVAMCAEPLHQRLRRSVNRVVHGEPEDPFGVLTRVGGRLAQARDGEVVAAEVLPEVVTAVTSALRLPYVGVSLADGSIVEHGRAETTSQEIELTYGGQRVGTLLVGPPAGGLSRTQQRLLDDLARHTAVAAHTVLLARDLARSRERLVAAREEERRRLYRDLHDRLGPSLAALALQTETARDLIGTDPPAATGLLDRIVPRLRTTVADVRTVVTGLRPPALDDLGLDGALAELGSRFRSSTLAVSVSVRDIAELPAAVEVAAYLIASEALTNAARHAHPTTVDVEVRRDGDDLLVTVDDDGTGIDASHPLGTGLASMRTRAAELSGTFGVVRRSECAGTRVRVLLPLGRR